MPREREGEGDTDEPPRRRDRQGGEGWRRQRDDEDRLDDENRPRLAAQPTGLDAIFSKSVTIMILAGLALNIIAIVLGLIGLAVCKEPASRRNAVIMTVCGVIMTAVGIALNLSGVWEN